MNINFFYVLMCVELTELRPIYLAYLIQTNEKNLNIEIEVHRIWY